MPSAMAAPLTAVSIKPRFFTFQAKSISSIRPWTKPFPFSAYKMAFRRGSPLISAAVAEADEMSTQPPVDPTSEAARRLYIGNIPRTMDNDDLNRIVAEHGTVEKVQVMYDKYSGRSRRFGFATMKSVEDANAVIEKLNGTQIGEREIKVNITEKPMSSVDLSLLQAEDSALLDSPYKVYVGNLARTVTTDTLKNFFSDKGRVVGAKVSRVPGTSKSSGFGFVAFSSEEDAEAAILAFNNSLLDGQRIRVNKA
ncbi:PREDICTED: 30S ribosomal protein 2, chloroplastic [Tarenaya hassleriana]|uniref:30S ribosomal protein 2, chloroplastic n=1 Tax=Tarenaya hassleriana TaxID=28532 RepID=UPI00053C180E|nr:PREDICTED: 30S ribosomal protein 2, chloroplastic [Tarenaya hassleriana]